MTLPRRTLLKGAVCCSLLPALGPVAAALSTAATDNLFKIIPGSKEAIHPVGMGTWITFNVGRDKYLREQRTQVLKTFLSRGGQVIDSSPMYGSSEDVLGDAMSNLHVPDNLFAATKIWSASAQGGQQQFKESQAYWQLQRFALLQVHNLLNWRDHLAFLRELKQQGLIRYLGVTTSHGRRHQELEAIMQSQSLDFVQLTYNVADREAEDRLLPLALDRGIAVIANRPFRGGQLFDRFTRAPLPAWHKELGITCWAQFFLKFILAHPAITCAIPATTQVTHMRENMDTAIGALLPDVTQRKEMLNYLQGV